MSKKKTGGHPLVSLAVALALCVCALLLVQCTAMRYGLFESNRDMKCKDNLKQIHLALTLYMNKFGGYPYESGDRFVAMLYYTAVLTRKENFLCPEDCIRDNARWVESGPNRTDWKFRCSGEMPEVDPATGSIYKDRSDWNENYFEPWEISYAGRRNIPFAEGADNEFYLQSPPREPTPIVADDCEDETGNPSAKPVHGDHINVLFSSGNIVESADVVGKPGTLEALED